MVDIFSEPVTAPYQPSWWTEKPGLEQVSQHHLCLRLYDVDVHIVSDSGQYLAQISTLFERFLVSEQLIHSPIRFLFLKGADNPWGSPVFAVDEQVWCLSSPIPSDEFIYTRILSIAVSRIQSHMMIHAGMVAHEGNGLMIVADSFHGKTTLVLELVRRGFRYLSDDMAAINRATGKIYPFPLRIGMRAGTWSLVMGDTPLPDAFAGSEKTMFDCEELWPGCVGHSVRCKQIVFLRSASTQESPPPSQATQHSNVVVDRVDENFLARVKALEGVITVDLFERTGVSILSLTSHNTTAVLSQIELVCADHGILLLYIQKDNREKPTFHGPSLLSPITKREAVLGLLNKFQGGYSSRILQQNHNGNPAHLLMALTSFVESTRASQLTVGPLRDMADHLCHLMDL